MSKKIAISSAHPFASQFNTSSSSKSTVIAKNDKLAKPIDDDFDCFDSDELLKRSVGIVIDKSILQNLNETNNPSSASYSNKIDNNSVVFHQRHSALIVEKKDEQSLKPPTNTKIGLAPTNSPLLSSVPLRTHRPSLGFNIPIAGTINTSGSTDKFGYEKVLTQGSVFLKHRSRPPPHKRFFFCSGDFQKFYWCRNLEFNPSKATDKEMDDMIKKSKSLPCNHLKEVYNGYLRAEELNDKSASVTFFLIFQEREFRLEANSEKDRIFWVKVFEWLYNLHNPISAPQKVNHLAHVDMTNFEWSGGNIPNLFEIKEQLGVGAFGSVHRIVFKETHFEMAVKTIKNDDIKSDINDIKHEVDILRSLRHKNICQYYGFWGPTNNQYWILMDYCAGRSIVDIMKKLKAPLPEPIIAYCISHALKGLVYLNSKHIAHRDIKAANLLVTGDGDVKLADFGLSANLEIENKGEDQQKEVAVAGSPHWMPSEVLRGNKSNLMKSDIWSLGITAIEMAWGCPPFSGLPLHRIVLDILRGKAPTLHDTLVSHVCTIDHIAISRNWSDLFQSFVSDCLEKDVEKRPTASQLLFHPFIQISIANENSALARGIKVPPLKALSEKAASSVDPPKKPSPLINFSLTPEVQVNTESKDTSFDNDEDQGETVKHIDVAEPTTQIDIDLRSPRKVSHNRNDTTVKYDDDKNTEKKATSNIDDAIASLTTSDNEACDTGSVVKKNALVPGSSNDEHSIQHERNSTCLIHSDSVTSNNDVDMSQQLFVSNIPPTVSISDYKQFDELLSPSFKDEIQRKAIVNSFLSNSLTVESISGLLDSDWKDLFPNMGVRALVRKCLTQPNTQPKAPKSRASTTTSTVKTDNSNKTSHLRSRNMTIG